MKNILIYGAGGHCVSLINLIEQSKKYKIAGIIGKKNELNDKILNYKINTNLNQYNLFYNLF